MTNRERFRGRPASALAVGGLLGLLAASTGLAVAGVDRRVAVALWVGVAASTYYALRYGDPVPEGAFVPARTVVQVLLWLVLVEAFTAADATLRFAFELLAMASVVLGVLLSVLTETTGRAADVSDDTRSDG